MNFFSVRLASSLLPIPCLKCKHLLLQVYPNYIHVLDLFEWIDSTQSWNWNVVHFSKM